jgi:hypothetical protein
MWFILIERTTKYYKLKYWNGEYIIVKVDKEITIMFSSEGLSFRYRGMKLLRNTIKNWMRDNSTEEITEIDLQVELL